MDNLQAGTVRSVIDERFRDEGAAAAAQAVNAATGKPGSKKVMTKPVQFTKDNAADPACSSTSPRAAAEHQAVLSYVGVLE